MKKKENRSPLTLNIACIKKLMSYGGGNILSEFSSRSISGYEASINGKEFCSSIDIKDLFRKIFSKTHKKTYYHDIILNFPKEAMMSYVTLHTGQLSIIHRYEVSEEDQDQMFIEMFRIAKENDIPIC